MADDKKGNRSEPKADAGIEAKETAPVAATPTAPWAAVPPRESTGASENARLAADYGETYQKGLADDGVALSAPTDDSHFTSYRLYAGKDGTSHPVKDDEAKGRWSTNEQDLTQLTPAELKARYALENEPRHIADRHHPAGQELTHSSAGENRFGPGGGLQIEARDERGGERNTPYADWNAEKQRWDHRPSGKFNRASNPRDYPPRDKAATKVGDAKQTNQSENAQPQSTADQRKAGGSTYGEERLAKSRAASKVSERETTKDRSNKDREP